MLVACGSAQPPTRRDPPAGSGSGSATPLASDSRPTDQACDALIAHTLTIELAGRPTDQQLTEAELSRLRATTRDRHRSSCRELAPATYQCMLAATTTTELTACK